jgi:hypothetical protein
MLREYISIPVSEVLKFDTTLTAIEILLDAARMQNENYERQSQAEDIFQNSVHLPFFGVYMPFLMFIF